MSVARALPKIRPLYWIGAPMAEEITTHLYLFKLFVQTLRRALTWPWRWSEIIHAIVQIGVESVPIIVIATAFAGIVVSNEMAWHMNEALHTVTMMPGFTGQFIFRELGIAIPAMLLVAKVGAAITAEVGSMKITEQIDALKLLGIDPISYLVFPRFIACMVSLACLTLIAVLVTLMGAIGVAVFEYHFSFLEYLNALHQFLAVKDVVCALVKGTIYGAVIPIISCGYGFRCKGGAEGVGSATTKAVITSTISVIILDFILTYIFTQIL